MCVFVCVQCVHVYTNIGQSLHRQLGVSRRRGVEVRQRMLAASTSSPDIPIEQNGGMYLYGYVARCVCMFIWCECLCVCMFV